MASVLSADAAHGHAHLTSEMFLSDNYTGCRNEVCPSGTTACGHVTLRKIQTIYCMVYNSTSLCLYAR